MSAPKIAERSGPVRSKNPLVSFLNFTPERTLYGRGKRDIRGPWGGLYEYYHRYFGRFSNQ